MAIRAHFLFLVGYIVQCAGNQCSDSTGTCSSLPRASLMQTKSMKKQALSAVEAASTRTQTLAGYKEYVNSLVETYTQGRKADGSDISQAIDTILSYIDSMYADLLTWHNSDVEETADCAIQQVIKTCEDTHLNSTVKDQFDTDYQEVDRLRQEHKLCRKDCDAEKCGGDVSKSCFDYHTYRKTNALALYTTQVACANNPAPGKLGDSYISTNKQTELGQMEDCLQYAKVWLDPLYEFYSNCEDDTTTCTSCKPDCDGKQEAFENAHCQVDLLRDIHCTGFDACYSAKTTSCASTTCPPIEIRSNARRADNETGELIRCLLKWLPSNATETEKDRDTRYTELANCNEKGKATLDSSFWNIDCLDEDHPTTPPHDHACGDVAQPCAEPFLQFEYESPVTGLDLEAYDAEEYAFNYNMINKCKDCGIITGVYSTANEGAVNGRSENNPTR